MSSPLKTVTQEIDPHILTRLRNGLCAVTCKVKDARSGCDCAIAADEIERLTAKLASLEASQGVPEGWKLVPVEPTKEMVVAAFEARDHVGNAISRAAQGGFSSGVMCMYAAMLSSAPRPAAGDGERADSC